MPKQQNTLIINAISGVIHRRMAHGGIRENVGTINDDGYLKISVGGKSVFVHRVIYQHFHGPIAPWMLIDHIRGKEAGNGVGNLRWVTKQGNMHNQREAPATNNSSGLLGVTWNKYRGRWHAQIMVDKKKRHLGYFESPNEAHAAYVEAKRTLHPTCTI